MYDGRPMVDGDSPARVVRDAFDPQYYLRDREDLRRSSLDPVAHYLRIGSREGRSPHPDFDTAFYREAYPDVVASGIDPFYHYLRFGAEEGRRPNDRGVPFRYEIDDGRRPVVSVLLPAFRPDYLDLCVACVLAQSFTDFELLVGDDSSGDAVQSILSKWQDPRIRYRSNPIRQVVGANQHFLLKQAKGRYIRFAQDDDMMFPGSLERLVDAAKREHAAMTYHARYDIDELGSVTEAIISSPIGEEIVMDAPRFFKSVVGTSRNIIGEPGNVLLDREILQSIPHPFSLDERPMQFLGDVALYANISDRGLPIVGLSYFGGAFRHHSGQFSNSGSPQYSAGLFEWEYLLRWASDRGHIGDDTYLPSIARIIHEMYVPSVERFPELQRFITLAGRGENGKYLSAEYEEALDEARAAVAARVDESKRSRG